MKSSELMLGDYIYYKPTQEVCKVITLHDKYVNGYCVPIGKKEWNLYVIREEKVDGIPPTPEILVKNDFQQISTNKYVNGKVTIAMFREEFLVTIKSENAKIMIVIKYVHELQHALRLCGINKKIKICQKV